MQAVKDLIKSRYSSLMWRSGLLSAWLTVRPRRRNPIILAYHHIDAATFADHLRCLTAVYHVVSLDRCAAYLAGQDDLPPNSVVITFDDAYRQFHDEIYPILKQFGAPAAMFVPTESIDRQEVLWFNRVKAVVHGADDGPLWIGGTEFAVGADRREAYCVAMGILNIRPIEERDQMLNVLPPLAKMSEFHLAAARPMTWEQMRRMRDLVTFGAHTVAHPNLAVLAPDRLRWEILESQRRLETELACEARYFAYPFGQPANVTEDAVEVLRQAGFAAAVTTCRGACRAGGDRLRLPRICCDDLDDGKVVGTLMSDLWVYMTT